MAGELSVSDETVEQVLEFILVLSEKLREIGHLFEENFDISTQEILVLSILAREGSLMVKDIACRMPGVSASTLTRILDRLEHHGSLVRTLNPVDRRSFRVILTEREVPSSTITMRVFRRLPARCSPPSNQPKD